MFMNNLIAPDPVLTLGVADKLLLPFQNSECKEAGEQKNTFTTMEQGSWANGTLRHTGVG